MEVSLDLCSDFAFVRVFEAKEPSVSIFVVGKIKVYFCRFLYENPVARKATLLLHILFYKHLCLSHDVLECTLNVLVVLYSLSKGE